MNIGLIGYGKMGQAIEIVALDRGHKICWKSNSENPLESQDFSLADVVIEFTKPQLAVEHIKKSILAKVPIVVGTTGWNENLSEIKTICESKKSALVHASNFSIGVNLFFQLNEKLASLMRNQSDYKATIEEIHHVQKLDSPSGTAITLANGILENNESYLSWVCGENEPPHINEKQLGVISYRLPNVPGTHSIEYKSEVDSIKIIHEAFNRDGFALGAVIAAEWIIGKTGVFTMEDVLNFNNK
jgi:4-hydroxy-tetrahydrodipicolinate reductase